MLYVATVSFFEPRILIEGKPLTVLKYESVLKEQLLIGILSKGAVTLSETNDLPVNDRRILLTTLQKAEDEKKRRLEEIRENRAATRRSRRF